jgi:excisionase family DNA binding protein
MEPMTPVTDTVRMDHNAPDDRLINTTRAARILGVTSQTVREWVRAGRLEAVRSQTGRFLVRAADVEALRPQPYTPDGGDAA